MDTNKKAMLLALEKSLGVVNSACLQVGVARQTHYNWLKQDDEYAKKVKEIQDIALDFVESKLYKLIQKESPAAVIFYLKTKGKSRGYSQKKLLK
jgi:hypothetical protein